VLLFVRLLGTEQVPEPSFCIIMHIIDECRFVIQGFAACLTQHTNTHTYIQIDSWEFNDVRLLFLSSSVGKDLTDARGNIHIYIFSDDQGLFVGPIQSIATMGASDVEPFHIPGEGGGDFLAIANRQSQLASQQTNLSVYDQDSVIYR
jgi:hypothetical protein